MAVDATQLRAIAERVRRQTTSADILEICDAVLKRTDCPVCVARRAAKAASQRKWRQSKSEASDG